MANQRPIRRGKIPFFRRRTKKRPSRWSAYTQESAALGAVASLLLPYAGDVEDPLVVLVDGDQDVAPWADEQEVTLDRVVGSISTQFLRGFDVPPTVLEANHNLIARYGLLVVENFETTAPPQINLWDQDAFEQYEWMWLQDVVPEESATSITQNDESIVSGNLTATRLDVRVRRKIGPKDQLLLYGSVGRMELEASGNFTFFARCVPALRHILMSR